MSDFFETTIKNYSGKSTETKPTTAAGNAVPNGSRWREVDTGKVWYFNLADDIWYLGNTTIDSSTHATTTIEYEHHEIHGGSAFTCRYIQTVSDTNDRSIITFLTPTTTKYLHITAAASATAAAMAYIWEAPTITNNTGAPLVVYNRRRIGTPTGTTVWDTSQNPNVQGQATFFTEITMGNVTGGTELDSIPLGSGAGPKTVGGMARGQQEWILKPTVLYAFEVKSSTNDANTHWIELNWYEHQDKS
jgi:hypothetical protein